jgi:hypothetical protein
MPFSNRSITKGSACMAQIVGYGRPAINRLDHLFLGAAGERETAVLRTGRGSALQRV